MTDSIASLEQPGLDERQQRVRRTLESLTGVAFTEGNQLTVLRNGRVTNERKVLTPDHLKRVFFTNSGSEANDTVMKLVWYWNNALGRPKKKKFVARIRGYHGITIASGSLTGLPWNHRDFDR